MGMDGLYRPSQAMGYTDALGHRDAADRAADSARQTPDIGQDEKVDAVNKDPQQREQGKRPPFRKKESDFGEELQDILAMQFDIAFDPTVIYRFSYNERTDRFELIDTMTGNTLLMLTPEAFLQVTQTMKRSAGMITDRSA